MSDYTIYYYYHEASKGMVYSAIHWRDAFKFLKEHPDAVPHKA